MSGLNIEIESGVTKQHYFLRHAGYVLAGKIDIEIWRRIVVGQVCCLSATC